MDNMTPYSIMGATRAQYDAIEAINQSALKEFERSAAHFYYKLTAPPKPPSKAMILGSLTEHMTLGTEFEYEPMRFDSFRTKESQTWRDDCQARGIPIVDDEMADKARAMTARVKALPEFAQWQPWRSNIALVGVHEPTGLVMKGLADAVPDSVGLILDLKTTDDASLFGFGKSIATWGYTIQGWWYQNLWRQVYGQDRQFCLVAVESDRPYEPTIQIIRQADLDKAGRMVDRWMAAYAECLRTDTWPGYSNGPQFAEVPSWLFKDV